MKIVSKISIALCFFFLATVAFATNGEEKKTSAKSTAVQQQGDKKPTVQKLDLTEETDEALEEPEKQTVDSTQDDSVSKYNFIFYFLYKMKYNEDLELEADF